MGFITQLVQGDGEESERVPVLFMVNAIILTIFTGTVVSFSRHFMAFSEMLVYESHVQMVVATVMAIVAAQAIFVSGMVAEVVLDDLFGGLHEKV